MNQGFNFCKRQIYNQNQLEKKKSKKIETQRQRAHGESFIMIKSHLTRRFIKLERNIIEQGRFYLIL